VEDDLDPVAAATSSFIGSYELLVGHIDEAESRAFGRVYAFATGAPISIFNGVIVSQPPELDDVDAALDWVSAFRVPYHLWVRESIWAVVARLADRRGQEAAAWRVPHMILEPIPDSPAPAAGVSVRVVADHASSEAFRDVLAATGVPPGVAAMLMPDALLATADARAFVAELDGSPAGTALAIRTGDVAGVYAVGTVASARRRGVGTAATWAAVEAARAWGSRLVALQSTEMGAGVYTAMGFRTIARFVELSPPRE